MLPTSCSGGTAIASACASPSTARAAADSVPRAPDGRRPVGSAVPRSAARPRRLDVGRRRVADPPAPTAARTGCPPCHPSTVAGPTVDRPAGLCDRHAEQLVGPGQCRSRRPARCGPPRCRRPAAARGPGAAATRHRRWSGPCRTARAGAPESVSDAVASRDPASSTRRAWATEVGRITTLAPSVSPQLESVTSSSHAVPGALCVVGRRRQCGRHPGPGQLHRVPLLEIRARPAPRGAAGRCRGGHRRVRCSTVRRE